MSGSGIRYAGVRLLDLPQTADREYDYALPPELSESVRRGSFVRVPLRGRSGCTGIVERISDVPACAAEGIKTVLSACPEEAAFSEGQLRLLEFLRSRTLCSTGDAAGAMIPSAVLKGYAGKTEAYFRPAVPPGELEEILAGARRAPGAKRGSGIGSPGQRAALEALLAAGGAAVSRASLCRDGRVTGENLRALAGKGLIVREDRKSAPALRLPGGKKIHSGVEKIVLNGEQQAAYDRLVLLASDRKPHAALLEGVTGSGKTCVMLRLIDSTLESGRGVILLLPEIALTPQTLAIFCSRYGDRVAVTHSGLSAGERAEAYLRIRSGEADLVIGTRSAVFAPLPDPGLIIIDEEQEHTYKSDSSPRYHARDIARFRCAESGALMLLASATPSLESRYRAEEGKYELLMLKNRYGNSVLPSVTVADMRREAAGGSANPIGSLLAGKLKETYARGEQSVLFLNRRGYNNYISCASCGKAFECPRCSVSMTYHVTRGGGTGVMVCHWCGLRLPVPEKCPECGAGPMIRIGYGTQKVEEELSTLVPGARVLRMDADSTSGRDAYDEMLGRFRRHEADILLGTQMVTKGHDFPDVTLVGVLLADVSLYYDDYRAAERTFALLTQVIGRAGRRDRPGEAVIQTNNPDSEIIRLAGRQDYESMYAGEIKLRRSLAFPPFCDIALLTLTSENEKNVADSTSKLYGLLRESAGSEAYRNQPILIFGPFEAPVYRVENRYRMRFVIKFRLNRATRAYFAGILAGFRTLPGTSSTQLTVDFGPTSL